MKVKAFITHKQSEKYGDCQDYFVIDKDSRAIAVSDGMSQSIFPGWWAEELTRKFISCPKWGINVSTNSDIQDIQNSWHNRVKQFVAKSNEEGKHPMRIIRLENCIAEKRGAGATLCGIRFDGQTWGGFALGDTCLFEIGKDNHVLNIYPKQENGFGNHPDYFDSMLERKGIPQTMAGALQTDGKLLIVSDPFAELIYNRWQEKNEDKIIERMFQVSSHEEFEQLVADFRQNEKMHNDDSTMVCVEFDGDEKFNVNCEDNLSELIEKEKGAEKEEEPVVEIIQITKEENYQNEDESFSGNTEVVTSSTTEENLTEENLRLKREREELISFVREKEKQLKKRKDSLLYKHKAIEISFVSDVLKHVKSILLKD